MLPWLLTAIVLLTILVAVLTAGLCGESLVGLFRNIVRWLRNAWQGHNSPSILPQHLTRRAYGLRYLLFVTIPWSASSLEVNDPDAHFSANPASASTPSHSHVYRFAPDDRAPTVLENNHVITLPPQARTALHIR